MVATAIDRRTFGGLLQMAGPFLDLNTTIEHGRAPVHQAALALSISYRRSRIITFEARTMPISAQSRLNAATRQ